VAGEPGKSPAPLRVRRRAVALGVAAALVGGSAVALERGLGARAADRTEAVGTTSGAWFCPHGGADGWDGWVVVTNPGTSPADVRISSLWERGVRSVTSISVGPGRQVYQQVFAGDPSASTHVEYFGGWVGAAAVIRAGGATAPIGAERCVGGPADGWFLSDQRTGRDENTYVVVMNPFSEEASFDVILRTERQEDRPKALSPFVLHAHDSVGILVNDHLLKGPGERTVAAVVVPRVGRVVAGGLAIAGPELRVEAGVAFPRARSVVPAAGYEGAGELLLVNAAASAADVLVVSEGPSARRPVAGPGGITLQPEGVRTIEVDELADASVVVHAPQDQAVAVAMRLAGEGGDGATITGAPRAVSSWLVMPTLPPSGGRAFLVLENPGPEAARISVQMLGPAGPLAAAGLESIPLPPGRTIQVSLPASAEGEPLSAIVTAESGTLVAAGASYSSDGSGYATTLGIPMKG
jgi:hypothetical protein